MLKHCLAIGLALLFLQATALAQTPPASGTLLHPSQLPPVPQSPPQMAPLHQPGYGYPAWVQQPPTQPLPLQQPPPGSQLTPIAPYPHMWQPYPPYAAAPTTHRKFPLEVIWDNGVFLESHDKQFRVHVGGNAQWDSTWLIGPRDVFAIPGGARNGAENAAATFLRRARIRLDGHIFERFDYMVEYDLANAVNENKGLQAPSLDNLAGSPMPTNVWVQIRELPYLGNVRIGQQVKPLGMTNNTYQGFLPFLERSYNMDAFYGPFDEGFVTGVSATNWTEPEWLTWRYGIFRPLRDTFSLGINHYLVAGRVTVLPVYEDEGRRLVHFGLASTYGDLVQDEFRLRARPVLRNGPGFAVPILVDTGEIPGSRQFILAPELALVRGSFTFQAEYAGQYFTEAVVNGRNVGTVYFHGGYGQVLYFLTGEHQEYDRREGVFGRVVPRNNFRWKAGDGGPCGAWQVGLRFGYLDLNDKAIRGGQVYDWTLGLNWFLNPNMKIQFNYMVTRRDGPQDVAQGWINGFGVRAACDF